MSVELIKWVKIQFYKYIFGEMNLSLILILNIKNLKNNKKHLLK